MLQFQIPPKPVQLLLGPCLDFDKVICSRQHATNSDHQQFNQIVLNLCALSRVMDANKYLRDS